MLCWLYYYISSEPPAWINYSAPCHNTEDALIMTDSQTRQCSKWQRESTCQSPLSVWLHHVTPEGEHLQISRAAPRHSKPAWMLDLALRVWGVNTTVVHKQTPVILSAWDSQRAVVIPGQLEEGGVFLLFFFYFFKCLSGMFHPLSASSRQIDCSSWPKG